jgi:protease-4
MLTSGDYMVAVGADHICVDSSTVTGSIGVRMDGWGLQNVLKRLDIERRSFSAGKHKERLDAYQPLSEDDKAKMAQMLSALHEQFIQRVEQGRGGRLKADREVVFSGDFWTGEEAVRMGLADEVCSVADVLDRQFHVHATRDFSPPQSVLSKLSGGWIKSTAEALLPALEEQWRRPRVELLP